MIDGYTLDYETATWSGEEVDAYTDPDDVRPDRAYVLRHYGRIVKIISRTLMETYQLLALDNVLIHNAAPMGHPFDAVAPEAYGWQSWLDYAERLKPTQPELLF